MIAKHRYGFSSRRPEPMDYTGHKLGTLFPSHTLSLVANEYAAP